MAYRNRLPMGMVNGLVAALGLSQQVAEKGQPGGYPSLDADGRISMDSLPQDLTEALVALVESQRETNERLKQTNELIFLMLQRTELDSMDKEIPANAS